MIYIISTILIVSGVILTAFVNNVAKNRHATTDRKSWPHLFYRDHLHHRESQVTYTPKELEAYCVEWNHIVRNVQCANPNCPGLYPDHIPESYLKVLTKH